MKAATAILERISRRWREPPRPPARLSNNLGFVDWWGSPVLIDFAARRAWSFAVPGGTELLAADWAAGVWYEHSCSRERFVELTAEVASAYRSAV
jgi:hypothetical protein